MRAPLRLLTSDAHCLAYFIPLKEVLHRRYKPTNEVKNPHLATLMALISAQPSLTVGVHLGLPARACLLRSRHDL